MISTIIFDWSGTLSNDFPKVYDTAMKVFDGLGLKRLTSEEYRREFVLPYMDFYRKFTKASKEIIDNLYCESYQSLQKSKPYPEVKRILGRLHGQNKRLFVLSSISQNFLLEEVEDYGLANLFGETKGGVHDKREEIVRSQNGGRNLGLLFTRETGKGKT